MKTLFLDFDGVLHRYTTGTFRHAGVLADLLQAYDQVQVVISSSWRLQEPLPELLGYLPDALAEKVVGCTIELPATLPASRQREIEDWVSRNRVLDWLVLDDDTALFSHGYSRLRVTDPKQGLTVEDLEAVRTWLEH